MLGQLTLRKCACLLLLLLLTGITRAQPVAPAAAPITFTWDSVRQQASFSNLPKIIYRMQKLDQQMVISLCYISGSSEYCEREDGLEKGSSKREFRDYYHRLVDAIQKYPAASLTNNDTTQLKSYTDTLYALFKKSISTDEAILRKQTMGNITSLTYNDSLSATIKMQQAVTVYKFNTKTKIFDSVKGPIHFNSASLYINDGFIYNVSFEIDSGDANRIQVIPGQSFGTRFNLKNNSFVNYMLSRPSYGNLGRYLEGVSVERDADFLKAARRLNLLVLTRDYRKFPEKIDTASKTAAKDQGAIERYAILPHELIHYSRPRSAPNNIFTARETFLNFNSRASFDTVRTLKEKSLYSFLNIDLFTDLIGLFGEEKPNGLLQTELKIRFYGFRRPIKQKNPSNVRVVPLDKGELFFRLSKLDNNLRYLDVLKANDSAQTRYMHMINLLQYQNTYAGIRANLIDFEYRGGSTAITSEIAFTRTGLRDTMETGGVKIPRTFSINTFSFSLGANFKFRSASFLDVDIDPRVIWLTPRTGNVQISGSEYSTTFPNTYQPILGKNFSKAVFTLRGMITINLNDDKTRRIILRGEHFNEMGNTRNNFWTAQIGYSADLNQFIKFN
jgi:hypothetical protein